jgi:hypothetical protein
MSFAALFLDSFPAVQELSNGLKVGSDFAASSVGDRVVVLWPSCTALLLMTRVLRSISRAP